MLRRALWVGVMALFAASLFAPPQVSAQIKLGVKGGLNIADVGGDDATSDLETKPWGMREFTVEDLNGNQLRMGMGVKPTSEIAEFTQG